MESILISTKRFLGYEEADTGFDKELIEFINTELMTLTQIGVGPAEGFEIEDETSTWQDFLTDVKKFSAAKSYIHKKVKLAFDSSTMSSALISAYERQIAEHEWRLKEAAELTVSEVEPIDYRDLANLPSINGETLVDNYDEKDPTVTELSEEDVVGLWEELFEE